MGREVTAAVVISDLHAGCQVGLCPIDGFRFDEGGSYTPNKFQKKVWKYYWEPFINEWIPSVTKGEDFCIVINGDSIDNEHHGGKHQWTQNRATMKKCAEEILKPIVEFCDGKFYMIRGSRAHDGTSGEDVEDLAKTLGAIPNEQGQFARYELWKYLKGDKALLHFMHHIGTTSTSAYESTAVHKELVESYVEAGRWGHRPPDAIIRSHRHRYFKTEVASDNNRAMSIVTPAWQGKTPFTYKIAGGRQSQPQFGGVVLKVSETNELYERHFVKGLDRPKAE